MSVRPFLNSELQTLNSDMSHRPIVIVNPSSGAARAEKALARLRRHRPHRQSVEVFRTEYAGHAREAARALSPSCPLVIIVGGDGTINEVVTGLMEGLGQNHPLPPIGLVPTGTANVLATELRVPHNVERALEIIAKQKVRRLDLGVARLQTLTTDREAKSERRKAENAVPFALRPSPFAFFSHPLETLSGAKGAAPSVSEEDRQCLRPVTRYFLCMAGAGFDAEVTRAYQAMRGKRSYVHHYIVPILLTIQNISLPKIKVVVDGRQAATNSSTVIVSNVRTYGVGMAVASHALFDDGLFDACIFTMRTSRDLARMFLDILVGKHVGKKDLLYRLGRVISLDSDALVPVQLDGDFAGYLPLKIELKPQAVSIFTP